MHIKGLLALLVSAFVHSYTLTRLLRLILAINVVNVGFDRFWLVLLLNWYLLRILCVRSHSEIVTDGALPDGTLVFRKSVHTGLICSHITITLVVSSHQLFLISFHSYILYLRCLHKIYFVFPLLEAYCSMQAACKRLLFGRIGVFNSKVCRGVLTFRNFVAQFNNGISRVVLCHFNNYKDVWLFETVFQKWLIAANN